MNLYLDIETLPTTDKAVIDALAETITAPGQYKKPESIAEWLKENKEQAVKDLVAKTSFDALYGSIACICYAFDDGEVFGVDCNSSNGESYMFEHFYTHIYDVTGVPHNAGMEYLPLTICGHNVAGFDLPFLKQRSIILEITPIDQMRKAMSAKKWDTSCIADTMLMWSDEPQKRVSMDKLCKAFGLEGKGDFDGSMVADTWPIDPNKVIEYCKDDVRRTREIYKRITFNKG